MKTPFEIKKGLRWCGGAAQIINGCSGGCPYYMGEDGCAEEDMHADALAYIQQLEAQVPKWISVEERLPDTRDWVLVIGKFVPEGFWCVPNIAEYFHDSWHIKDAMCSSPEDLGIKVTHWMPLPEPPKEV